MEHEILKQKFITEAHNHFVLVSKTKPFKEFYTFVESLRRNENKTLIESIKRGVMAIIEGEFQNENDPGRKLLRKSQDITIDELNKLIENGDSNQIMALLYPYIIQSIDKAGFKNIHTADKVFNQSINDLLEKIANMKPMQYGDPSAFLANYVNMFITSTPIKNAKSPTVNVGNINHIVKDSDIKQEEGNLDQFWEYRDESKRIGGKAYGKALEFKNVNHHGDLVPMVYIKWKGLKNRAGNYIEKPIKEWVVRDELQAYNLRDTEVANVDSMNLVLGDGTLEDRIASDAGRFSDKDEYIKMLNNIKGVIDTFDFRENDENVKKALNEYFYRVATANPDTASIARTGKIYLQKYLNKGIFPNKQGTSVVNPKYDSVEKIKNEIKSLEYIINENESIEIAPLAEKYKLGRNILIRAIDKINDAVLDNQELWDSYENIVS